MCRATVSLAIISFYNDLSLRDSYLLKDFAQSSVVSENTLVFGVLQFLYPSAISVGGEEPQFSGVQTPPEVRNLDPKKIPKTPKLPEIFGCLGYEEATCISVRLNVNAASVNLFHGETGKDCWNVG